jgi:D-glycero-D-manno-heptose 1,7-bisphosphate phosphatase
MTKRVVFLDRDGTLIEHYDYLTEPEQVKLMPTAVSALRLLRDRGFALVMVTNQSAIARGLLTEEKLQDIHKHLQRLLAQEGVFLDGMYYCPYHPEAVLPEYRRESDLRKPAPGMFQLAARELDLSLEQSWMVGDDDRDILAGQTAGCRTILLSSRGSELVHRGDAQPDYQALNLQEAANLIVRYADESPLIADKPISENQTIPEGDTPVTEPQVLEEKSTLSDQPQQPEEAQSQTETPPQDASVVSPSRPARAAESDLLQQILRELRSLNRQQRFSEFSVLKLLAGVIQMVVILCLILAFGFGTGLEDRTDSVHTFLLLAGVLQVMVLSLLVMHKS